MLVSHGIQPATWLMWTAPIVCALLLFLLWGRYQYRLCILNQKRNPYRQVPLRKAAGEMPKSRLNRLEK